MCRGAKLRVTTAGALLRRASAIICLTLAAHAAPTRAQDSATVPRPAPTPPPYLPLRYEEDWSFLRDERRRTDPFDRLKYIPLSREGDSYLSLGGETRHYYNRYGNPDFGNAPPDGDGYFLQRYLFHADLHLGSRVRVFGQLKSGISNWQRGGPGPVDEDKLDVNQLFVDLNFGARRNGAGGGRGRPTFVLRLGRQELQFGSGRMVARREGPNVPNSFDGVRATVNAGAWRVDAFAAKLVSDRRGYFDDGTDASRSFWGAYLTRPARRVVRGNVDLYYLGNDYRRARFNQGTARESRHTVGARAWRQNDEGWSYDYELVGQFGSFGRGNIRAWRAATDTAYTFAAAPLRPRVGFIAEAASGDRDPADPDLQTFNALFQSGTYSGRAGILGAANAVRVEPSFNFRVAPRASLATGLGFYWRASARDGVYGIPGNLIRSGDFSRAHYLGVRPIAEVEWRIERHLSLSAQYIYVFTGKRFARETQPPGRDLSYVAVWTTFRF